MVFSDEKKYIGLRISKCGSRSLMYTLVNAGQGQKGNAAHMPPQKIIDQLGPKKWNKYFKFAFVRNPWDHFVSVWIWHQNVLKQIPKDMPLYDFAFHAPNMFKPFRWFQHWLSPDGHICVDYIGKTETMQEDFDKICSKVGIPQTEILHVESTGYNRDRDYRIYYEDNKRLIEQVRTLYDPRMIEYLGYEFDHNN